MEDVSGSSEGESPVVREVIDLESDYEDDEDRVRQDMYEDFDELADLAVTASEEPPPPGTRVCPGFFFPFVDSLLFHYSVFLSCIVGFHGIMSVTL